MKTLTEVRLECLRLAVTMAASKAIDGTSVMKTAKSFYAYVQDEPDSVSPDAMRELQERYRR